MPPPSSGAVPRGTVALLRDPTFGSYFFGKVLSSCGIWAQSVTAAVVMFQLTGSAAMVGAVSSVQFAGPLVLALWAGSLTDRVDRRKLLLSGRVVSSIAAAVLAGLIAARGVEGFGGPPVLLACTAVLGVGLAISSPAMHALVPALVPAEDLEQALALNAVVGNIARAVGPALGTFLLVAAGPATAFAAASGAHLLWALALLRLRPRAQVRAAARGGIFGGLRYVREDPKAAALLASAAALSFAVDPVITLTPPLAERLGGGEALVGVLAGGFGVGAVALSTVMSRLRKRMTLRTMGVTGLVVAAAGLTTIGMGGAVAVAVGGFVVVGAGFILAQTAFNTRIQRRVPDELRGRVMALWSVAFVGSRPVAASVNGLVADHLAVEVAVLIGALVCLAAIAGARVTYHQG